jgi:hypothetical protein
MIGTIEMIPVSSSAISAIGYDGDTLRVEFRNGRTYDHPGVPEEVFYDFLNSASKGRFYNNHIKGRY